jgi:hypothetical protein
MARDYKAIASTVQSLIEKDAPDTLINKYLAAEGLSFSQFQDVLKGPTLVGQAKEFVKGIPAGLVGTLGTAVEGAAALPIVPESLEKSIVTGTRKAVEALSPDVTPGYEDTVGRKLGEATGSIGSFVIPGGLFAKGISTATGLSKVAAGTLAGTSIGGAAGAGEARQRAEMEGATPEERATATALGILPGLSEALPTGRLLRFLAPAKKAVDEIPKTYADKLFKRGEEILTTAGIEGLQEWSQGLGQNMIAQGIYKPDQKLFEGLGEQAAYGAGAGAIAEVFFNSILGKKGIDTRTSINEKIKAAQEEAVKQGEPQQVTLMLPYSPPQLPNDPNVRPTNQFGETQLVVYPDGSTAFASEAAARASTAIAPEIKQDVAELKAEKPELAAEEVKPVVTEASFKKMGIGPTNKKLRAAILGKDLTDPAQVAEVKTALEEYAGGKNRSEKIIKGVETFLTRPEFQEPAKVEETIAPIAEPKKRAKKTKEVIEEAIPTEEQAALQEELLAELEQPETQYVGERNEPIAGAGEPSVPVPSERGEPAPGVAETGQAGLAGVVSPIRQPLRGEKPVEPALTTPAVKLSPSQEESFQKAAAKYIQQTKTPEQALEYLAGDLYAKENSVNANNFKRGLSPDQMEIVNRKIAQLKQYEARGKISLSRRTAEQDLRRAELAQNEKAISAAQEKIKKIKAKMPKVERDDVYGGVTPRLVMAVERGNTRAALQEIIDNDSDAYNILEKLVARRLLSVRTTLPNIEVAPKEQIGADGEYNPFTDTVRIAQGEIDSHTVLHELTHGYLHSAIQKYEAGAFNKGIADLDRIYKDLKARHPELASRYGMTNLSEFASEAMSNREFQRELAQIPTQRGNVFTEFARAVLRALGLSPTEKLSALADTMIAADRSLAFGRKIQEDVVTGKETLPTAKVARTAVDDDIDAMGNIANEKAKAPDKTLLGKIGAFTMDPAYRQEAIDRFRTQVTYKGAAVESKLKREYNNAIRNELGELRPDVLALQAEHSDNIASQAILKGGIRIDPNSGLWQAVDKEASLANTFNIIAELGTRIGSQEKAYELANKTFIGRRAGDLKRNNERLEKAAEAAEAKGDKKSADQLRSQTIYIHANDEQIAAAEKAYQKYPELRAAFKEFTDFKNGLIDVMVDTGRLTKEQAADWKSKVDYVPWNRIKEYEENIQGSPKSYFKGLVNLGQLGKLTGSDDQINNVFDNMVGLSFWMVNSSVRNHAASKMVDALTKIDAREVKPGMAIDPTRTIYVYKDGVPRVYELGTSADVYAFKGIESIGGPLLDGFSSISNLLRKTTTAMPSFAVSQLFQDSYRAMLMSGVKSPLKIPGKVLGNFVGALRKDSLSDQLASYGIVGAYDLVPNRAKDEIEKTLGIKRRGITETIFNKFEDISLASDAAQRRAVFEQTMAETGDMALALYRAQEIINFKRQGANRTIGVLRQIVPFFNAYLQGMDVLARTMAGTGLSTAEKGEAIRLFLATATKLTVLSTIYAAMVAGDDEYEQLRDYEKDKSFIIPGTGLKIPVAPEVGFMFKVIPERMYHYIMSQGTERPDDAKKTMIGLRDAFIDAFTGPNLTPQAVKPALEVMVNYSFFTGAPIIGRGMDTKEAYLQFTNSTSELAKLIGGATNTSPMKWDYLMKGYTGIAGGTVLALSDEVISQATGAERPDRRIYELPQFRTFMYDKVAGGDKEDFYSLRDEVRRTVDTVNALKADGRVEELQKYLENPDKFGLYLLKSSINGIEQRLEDIRKYKKVISADPNMLGADKKDTLEQFELIENELLRAFNIPRLRAYARSME